MSRFHQRLRVVERSQGINDLSRHSDADLAEMLVRTCEQIEGMGSEVPHDWRANIAADPEGLCCHMVELGYA